MTGERINAEPAYPILSPNELSKIQDVRHQLPRSTQDELGDHDTVIHVVTPEISKPALKPSAVREILRLTRASSVNHVRKYEAPLAGLSSSENTDVESLRKFEAVHGRDALEIALKLHTLYPDILHATLHTLAETQGTTLEIYREDAPYRQEEPGRIMLLNRHPDDPIGKKFSDRLHWGWPFYGSIDATPSFVTGIAKYTEHDPTVLSESYTTKDGEVRTIQEALDSSVGWILHKLESSPSGFIEFKNNDPKGGISAQAWKDSAFAYVHADGTRANHNDGIASVEVQALAYDALLDAAAVYNVESPRLASELAATAADLRERILRTFWIDGDKGGYFALATDYDEDRQLRTLNVRTSNMGHLLNSRLLDGNDERIKHMRESVIKHTFSPELLHKSGVRTFASDEVAFRPGGYHTGSVWLWDTAYIADGLEHHGFHRLAWNLRGRVQHVIDKTGRFPEFVRSETGAITTNPSEIYVWNSQYNVLHLFEQPPQEIQGWTVSAALAAKHAWPKYQKIQKELQITPLEQSILAQI